jgi:serine/threonine-protein kinase HipA
MNSNSLNIYVYADWHNLFEPIFVGTLLASRTRGKELFSFEYDNDWINSTNYFLLDPSLIKFTGKQFPESSNNFGVFFDSMPDTWGKKLMIRNAADQNSLQNKKPITLFDSDYLLNVFDKNRIGALRFKSEKNGPFLNNNAEFPTPPWAHVNDLQKAVNEFESKNHKKNNKWLPLLFAPGSSLGGARPKANILDQKNNLWIAKFPSKLDTIDKAQWEYLAYKLACKAGITMSDSKIEKVFGTHHTFFTKRFDRIGERRIHYASAMTMTSNNEEKLKNFIPSYLEIIEFIQNNGCEIQNDLQQIWRRIIFNISISNTDDHLRNHGFLLTNKGWKLSPAFDINPSLDKSGLSLNIDMNNNYLDFTLAKSIGPYCSLNNAQMNNIINEVKSVIDKWKIEARNIGISKSEITLMQSAFELY